ncbi:MAG TPA: hypothetical protein VJL57_01020 [Candidatus Paceibacterota bacterium]
MTAARDAKFYFANLGVDVARCATAAIDGNMERYAASRARAIITLDHLHHSGRPEAYEEGLLLMRALEYARADRRLEDFKKQLDAVIAPFALTLSTV